MRRAFTRALPAAAVRTPRSAIAFRMPSSAQNSKIATRRLHATAQHLKPATAPAFTADNYPTTHEKIQNVQDTPYFVDNKFVKSDASHFIELHDPATNNLVTRVPQSTDAELKAAVESAQKAFPAWRATSVMARQQIMFKFTQLVRENWDRLAASITLEQGKTFAGMFWAERMLLNANIWKMLKVMFFVDYK
jgi:malonate-semialdehyde dehydrogenase (acetylating)/methylmalonate-semialdehyde dehydrogenase